MDSAYDIIVIDPPWRFSANSDDKPGRGARAHYDTMTDAQLVHLPIPLARPGLLFVWVTAPMQWRAHPIIEAWGVKPVAEIVWVKDRVGTGYWARNWHEMVWICKKGAFPCPRPAPFQSVIHAPRREHSRKPDQLQDRIDEIWPDASKLEMFARARRPGWDAWGHQVERFT